MEMDPVSLPQEARAKILRRFEVWLDRALAEESPPEGVAAALLAALDAGETLPPIEGQCDLYSLWSSMTALTQEVKIQSRTFRQLNDSLATTMETFAEATSMGSPRSPLAGAASENSLDREAEPQIERDQIDLLLDLRDRLDRGLQSVREADKRLLDAPQRSLFSLWFGAGRKHMQQTPETLTALEKGYALTLHRLDQALQDSQLHPILCEGQAFDPHRMTAVELEETDSVPEGTVLGIYSTGYEWRGQLYRAAQVKVARPSRKP